MLNKRRREGCAIKHTEEGGGGIAHPMIYPGIVGFLSLSRGDTISRFFVLMTVDPRHRYSNEAEGGKKDIYDDNNLKQPSWFI